VPLKLGCAAVPLKLGCAAVPLKLGCAAVPLNNPFKREQHPKYFFPLNGGKL